MARSYRIELAGGRRLFAKTHPAPPPGFFSTEAAGLRWLRRAPAMSGCPRSSPSSDEDPTFLVLEWIDEGRPAPTTDASLGTGLAALHRAGAPSFGREDRRSTGSRGLPNEPCATWTEFYATNRLLPLARLARDAGAIAGAAIAAMERLAGRLDDVGGADEPPARLHGDLWSGNRLVGADGANWLIDPAAHGGHREFDLAMMRLFGGFGADCFERLRGGLAAGRRLARTASRCTRSPRSSCTPSSSVAPTSPRRSAPSSAPEGSEREARHVGSRRGMMTRTARERIGRATWRSI